MPFTCQLKHFNGERRKFQHRKIGMFQRCLPPQRRRLNSCSWPKFTLVFYPPLLGNSLPMHLCKFILYMNCGQGFDPYLHLLFGMVKKQTYTRRLKQLLYFGGSSIGVHQEFQVGTELTQYHRSYLRKFLPVLASVKYRKGCLESRAPR